MNNQPLEHSQLAQAILMGARKRPQSFGHYFDKQGGSCALGAAYEGFGIRLPRVADWVVPRHIEEIFPCLDDLFVKCPAGCGERTSLGELLVHLNDDHRWTREAIADWVAKTD